MAQPAWIGSYRVDRALGTGAFATVWLATDELLDDRVAVKVLADNWSRHPEIRSRFIEEAKILRRIDDDHIVRVHQIGVLPDDRPYFVMTWADRATLHDRLKSWRRAGTLLSPGLVGDYVGEIAACLGVVHENGIVHRDVKPSNILFRSVRPHRSGRAPLGDEQLLLGDFGLAKNLAQGSGFTLPAGTPAYMAPEQARPGTLLDHRADLFALTAVAFELLTGQAPYLAETLGSVARGERPVTTPRLAELRAGLGAELQDVIDRGLHPDPEQRFGSADELAAHFRTALHGGRVRSEQAASAPAARVAPSSVRAVTGAHHDAQQAVVEALDQLAARLERPDNRALVSEAKVRLAAPLRLTVVGPVVAATAVATALGGAASIHMAEQIEITTSPDPAAARRADALVVTIGGGMEPTTLLAALASELASAPAGPVLAVGATTDPGERSVAAELAGADPLLRKHLSGILAVDGSGGPAVALGLLADRADEIRLSAAVASLEAVLRAGDAGLAGAASQFAERLDAVRLAVPGIGELQVLRDDVAGRLGLSDLLRDELRRTLGLGDIDRRLGLASGSSPDERNAAARRGAERWRTLANTGRIPFSARRSADVVERSYERLWSISVG